jgi:hypothetical protein
LASCKNDEGEISAGLVGKWQGDHLDAKVQYGVITVHEEEDDQFDSVLEFKDDGTVSFTKNGRTTKGTYQLNGRRLTTNVDLQFDELDITEVTFDVLELTASRLRLYLEQDQDVQVPDVGNVTATVKGNLHFNRQ